ncbi:transglycosylase SLT domain-containing protein [Candidatus Gracilibacteria bacterium]|nr:transglycosylase SLT domain-containing protein [Candidatus Gracilibacteria bacterium]
MQFRVYYKTPDSSSSPDTSFVGRLFESAKTLPSNVPEDIRTNLAKLSAEINGGAEELKGKGSPEADERMKLLKEKSRSVLQSYGREGRTAELKNNAKYEKILRNAKSFDEVKAGDVLRLKSYGENIGNYLLTLEDGDTVDLTKGVSEFIGKKILINFGSNKSINASIGLGDLLPYEAKKVQITKPNGEIVNGTLGTADSRKGRKERVGYYDENGKYIAVYSGYSIKIIEVGKLSDEDNTKYAGLENTYMESIRVREMHERRRVLGDKYKDEFQDDRDKVLFEKVEQYAQNYERRKERAREVYGSVLGKERFLQLFGPYVNEVCKEYDLPPTLLVRLFEGETSGFDVTARNKDTGAYGLGQIIPSTWLGIENKILRMDLDENDPKDQILGSVALLADIKKRQNVSWERAAILYHTGEGLPGLSKATIDEYLRVNAKGIRENFRGNSSMSDKEYAEAYAQAAGIYYGYSGINTTNFVPLTLPESPKTALSGHISHPIEYTVTGVTACSTTAWKNLREFGILGPRGGSAKESEALQENKKLGLTELFTTNDSNIADMYVDSLTPNGRIWGHRCVAVRGNDNIWYVLDPYYGSKLPTPIDTYLAAYEKMNGTPNPRFYPFKGTNYLSKMLLG